jgi:electron transport complex protein RnfC
MLLLNKPFAGGVPAPHRKNTADMETVVMDTPSKVIIPMVQHIGAPCRPTVKKGDIVKLGQVIGDSDAYVSAPVHSSVSGTVKRVEPMLYASGHLVMSVEIEADNKQEIFEGVKAPSVNSRDDFIEAIRRSGLVGLGGAGFPSHVKLNPPKDKKIEYLIINAAECEPYITSDYRECIEFAPDIIKGIKLVLDMLGIPKAVIGFEDNKPKAISLLKEKSKNDSRISVCSLRSRYPQGAEKTLIYAVTGRKVPPGKLPAALMIKYSIFLSFGGFSFTCDGKPAPPRPTRPDLLMASIKSSLLFTEGAFTPSNISCLLSASISTDITKCPLA